MIKTAQELTEELQAFNPRDIREFEDTTYYCPPVSYLTDLGEYHTTDDKWVYIPQTGDCDNAATDAENDASESARKNPKIHGHEAAFFKCKLLIGFDLDVNGIKGPGAHKTNIVRCKEGWYFYERQTGKHCTVESVLDHDDCVLKYVGG